MIKMPDHIDTQLVISKKIRIWFNIYVVGRLFFGFYTGFATLGAPSLLGIYGDIVYRPVR